MGQSINTSLSKSLILKGLQCRKALWLTKNPPAFELPPKPDLQALFRAGTEVGILAQQLFPGGVEVPYKGLTFAEQLIRTKQLIDSGAEVIYEATFSFSAVFVKVDILVRDGAAWQIHEVKMGTGVKDVNLNDVAVQHYVLNGCGLSVSKSFLVHIDNSYVRQGDIEVDKLFASEDISQQVLAHLQGMPEVVTELRVTLREAAEPTIDIGPHCTDPYECDFIPYCWQHIPEDSIFDLRGRGVDKFALYRQGIIRLEDAPLDQLDGAQRFQAEATLERKDVTDPEAVRTFIDSLWYPLCHLDFETFDAPIPPFDGVRPYQKIPFQYSLHIQQQEGAEPEHFEYLAASNVDPRRELIERLLAAIPAEACILTYNQAFEKGVLRELAKLFPDLAEAIEARLDNVRDLMQPFKRRDVYRWSMRGSYSIKQVLPALVPELSYAGLEIADGMAAMQAYREMCEAVDPARAEGIRRDLLAYCKLDTLAMVSVLGELRCLAYHVPEPELLGKIIYVDANMYLRFFDSSGSQLGELLDYLEEKKDYLFVTKQIMDEVLRTKLSVTLKYFISNGEKLGINKTSLPEHLDFNNGNVFCLWNKERNLLIKKEIKLKSQYDDIVSEKLNQITKSHDSASININNILKNFKEPNDDQLNRARLRKELGNPPGKRNDPLGDQISWEQLLDEYKGEELWIISNDDDYTLRYKKGVHLNPLLYEELKSKSKGIEPVIHLFRDLKEGISDFRKSNESVKGDVPDR